MQKGLHICARNINPEFLVSIYADPELSGQESYGGMVLYFHPAQYQLGVYQFPILVQYPGFPLAHLILWTFHYDLQVKKKISLCICPRGRGFFWELTLSP